MTNPIKVVDLFAGPGGLGEGFSSLEKGEAFSILLSAEMDPAAHKTLQLRAYYRGARGNKKDLAPYYRFCNESDAPPMADLANKSLWEEAEEEAQRLTLGTPESNKVVSDAIRKAGLHRGNEPWILIGGPPCQAYSLVGRARNRGKADYDPKKDGRHFLYVEYLRLLHEFGPPLFVMENVKGILSSEVGGKKIFHEILQDLANPSRVFGKNSRRHRYRIHSLVSPTVFSSKDDVMAIDPHSFVVRAERFGIPQARHRVILVGVREDLDIDLPRLKSEGDSIVTVANVLSDLPHLRSSLSKRSNPSEPWHKTVRKIYSGLAKEARENSMPDLSKLLRMLEPDKRALKNATGELRLSRRSKGSPSNSIAYPRWFHDGNLQVWLNHETRSHIEGDLRRYAYAAAYAKLHDQKRSPKGHLEFSLPSLAPNHKNWKSGKFADRFRVQLWNTPSTTITSHISKDGHYFIHPDPQQCRSLTVREAARLQTFPDNYFFQGNRTQQYVQVGNAVPPMLARAIAGIIRKALS
jgi:DNA (cytosine-5)-methyltransferase 1